LEISLRLKLSWSQEYAVSAQIDLLLKISLHFQK